MDGRTYRQTDGRHANRYIHRTYRSGDNKAKTIFFELQANLIYQDKTVFRAILPHTYYCAPSMHFVN